MPGEDTKPVSALREVLRVAGPTVATMTSYTVMQFTDKWLVSRLGPEFVGGQGNGGLLAWVPQSLAVGSFTVINTYVSQNIGAGKPERGPAYAWNGLYLAVLWWLLLLPYGAALPWVVRLAKVDPAQAEMAVLYGRILIGGCVLNMCTRAISQFFYGMHKARVVMTAGVCANVINLFLAALLVFGNGPTPDGLGAFGRLIHWLGVTLHVKPQGIAGSAWGTVIACGFELAIPMLVFLGPKLNALYKTRAAWRPSWPHLRDIIKLGWPSGLMFGNEMICWGFFMVYLVSHFGINHGSAGWIAHQYMSLSFMPAVGISVACTALVGKYVGMGRQDIAQKRAWLCVKLAAAYMGLCGIAFVVFRAQLVRFFVKSDTPPEMMDELISLGSQMLIASACFQLFDGAAMVLSGALRGAGDTLVPGLATVLASWLVIVGGGFVMVEFAPGLKSIGPWMAAAAYIIILCMILLVRFVSGKWKLIKLLNADENQVQPEHGVRAVPMEAPGATTDGIM